MSLRIIAGRFGGRRIEAPPGKRTRPTREVVREAWFSALGRRIDGATVADLYAGSGALGIEALSRGARSVHFVEADRRACAVLRRNLRRLGVESQARVTCGDALAFVGRLGTVEEAPFDIALADPPYESDEAARLVERFRTIPFASILCVEHAPDAVTDLPSLWSRRYGDTSLSFFGTSAEGASGGD